MERNFFMKSAGRRGYSPLARVMTLAVMLLAMAATAWAQETKYTVTMAEGTVDAANWTIDPTEAAEGKPITATYSGTKHVKSVTAVTKAAAPAGPTPITLAAKLAYTGGEIADFTDATADLTTMTWAVGEHIAVLYEVGGTKKVADAEITAVDGTTGEATIEFTVEAGTANDTPCTLVYPLSAAKDDHSGVKDAATLLAAQDGTLNANLDVRVGAGTIQTTTPGLTVTTQPEAQFAIWKLTLNNSAKNLCIMADNAPIAGATLATAGTEFYVAVPAVSSKTVTAVASDESNNCYYFSKAGVSLNKGRFYQSTPTMTTLDTSSSAAVYKITGTSSATIPAGKTAVLSGVNITNGNITCSGDATIILVGNNTVTGASNNAAIQINLMDAHTMNYTLTITGTGSLTAQGGDKAAGIGSGNCIESGNIIITGGTIIATGGNKAAGIGSGYCADAKNITITNTVTKVTATKGSGAEHSIGGGAIGGMFYGCRVTIDGTNYDGISTSPYTYEPGK